jgi:predicted N-acetyltransferase YhbS
MKIIRAEESNLQAILELQYLAYQGEAKLLDDFTIPPLKQTIEEVQQEFTKGIFLKAVDESNELIGSVRAWQESDTVYIGKLIVQPKLQSRGIGSALVKAIEREFKCRRYEIFTSVKSIRTIQLYEHLGYVKFREQKISDKLTLVFLEKIERQ